jgi:AhpD family alkylhydroperoxidase
MKPRIDVARVGQDGYRAMLGLEKYLASCGLDHNLMHVLKLRASQINGCAYCIDMHWKDATAGGESAQRLYGLNAWRETEFYTPRERAALEWVERLTRIMDGHAPDEAYEGVREHFSEKEIVDLTLLASTINAWNRIAIALRSEAGTYKPAKA